MTTLNKKTSSVSKTNTETLKRGHDSQIEQAGRYIEVLELIGTEAATQLVAKIRDQLLVTQEAVNKAEKARYDITDLGQRSKRSNADFKLLLDGVPALVRLGAPKLADKLPDREAFPSTSPDTYADALGHALADSGSNVGADLGKLILHAKANRLATARAYEHAVETQGDIQKGRASSADLAQLLKAAESYIHTNLPPKSPAYALLKRPRKAASGTTQQTGSSTSSPAAGTGGHAQPTPAGTPAPTPSPAPVGQAVNEAPAPTPVPVAA